VQGFLCKIWVIFCCLKYNNVEYVKF
jgi:hypothetical protein